MQRTLRIFAVPFMLLLAGCTASPLAYPHFWDYTKARPNEIDLVGTYRVRLFSGSFGSIHGFQGNRDFTLTIHADHTAVLSRIPAIDSSDKVLCTFSGPAVWKLDDHGDPDADVWYLEIFTRQWVDSAKKAFRPCDAWEMLLLGRHAPYRLYQTVGDPDNDTGIEFARVAR